MSRSTRVLLAATLAAGLFELGSAPFLEVPAVPAAVGAIFLLAAFLLYRGRGMAPAVLGLAFLVELAGLPFYERNSVADWIVQMGFGALSLVGLVAAVAVVFELGRARLPRRGVAYGALGLFALAAVVVAATACGGGENRAAVADRGSSAEAELQQALDEVVAAGAPGALVLVRAGDRTMRLTSGYGNLKPKTPLQVSDRFRAGSVTKTFVATVVLQLVAEGKLGLDDTVEGWLPGLVPNGEKITVRQLLNMTSGLFDYLGDGDTTVESRILGGDWEHRWTPHELVAIATAHDPKFAPGAGWSYCNTCYILLGLIVEKATGNPITVELQTRVFAPQGLRATSLDTRSAISGPHARGYERLGDPSLADVSSLSPSFAWTAGAIVSTADDLARFYRALLRGNLLRPHLRRVRIPPPPLSSPRGSTWIR